MISVKLLSFMYLFVIAQKPNYLSWLFATYGCMQWTR